MVWSQFWWRNMKFFPFYLDEFHQFHRIDKIYFLFLIKIRLISESKKWIKINCILIECWRELETFFLIFLCFSIVCSTQIWNELNFYSTDLWTLEFRHVLNIPNKKPLIRDRGNENRHKKICFQCEYLLCSSWENIYTKKPIWSKFFK